MKQLLEKLIDKRNSLYGFCGSSLGTLDGFTYIKADYRKPEEIPVDNGWEELKPGTRFHGDDEHFWLHKKFKISSINMIFITLNDIIVINIPQKNKPVSYTKNAITDKQTKQINVQNSAIEKLNVKNFINIIMHFHSPFKNLYSL